MSISGSSVVGYAFAGKRSWPPSWVGAICWQDVVSGSITPSGASRQGLSLRTGVTWFSISLRCQGTPAFAVRPELRRLFYSLAGMKMPPWSSLVRPLASPRTDRSAGNYPLGQPAMSISAIIDAPLVVLPPHDNPPTGVSYMRSRIVAAGIVLTGLLICQAHPFAQEATQRNKKAKQGQARAVRLVPAAKAFLEGLSDEQRSQATMEYGSDKRVQWHFIPMETRKGLPIMEMEAAQKKAAMKLLRAAVSKLGYDQASIIMQLEGVLLQLEGPESKGRRNPEKYYFTIFGKVGQKERWGLSIEGHHLSLNFVLNGNTIIDSTPQFFASNPAELKESYGEQFPKGLRVLRAEEQLGFKLVKSLSETQLAGAKLPGDVPAEIRAAGQPQPPTDPARGISAADLTEEQRGVLKKLMRAYTAKMKPMVVKQRWEAIEKAGFEKIKFAWAGATRPGIGHYYAVQGPTFVIEFVNVQPDAAGNPANHVHCVWRDMQGDFDLPIATQ